MLLKFSNLSGMKMSHMGCFVSNDNPTIHDDKDNEQKSHDQISTNHLEG